MNSAAGNNTVLSEDDQKNLLKQMILIRRFEEKAAEYYGKGMIRGFLHLYNGEEAIAAGVLKWRKGEDRVISTYREHGHAIASGIEPRRIMAELFGKKEGCSGGRGGSMHLFDASRNFFGGNAIVGGHLPIAVGMAFADKLQKKDQITFCFLGEGAVAEGIFHESMNLGSLLSAPVLFIVENNLYAMGTHISKTMADQDFSIKAKSYGIGYHESDGMDLRKILEAARNATNESRAAKRPVMLLMNTYRFRAHSMFDAELYREKSEVDEWKKHDPIESFKNQIISEGILTQELADQINTEVDKILEEAISFAQNGSEEPLEGIEKHLTDSGD